MAVLPNYGRIVKKNIVIRYHKQNDEMLKTLRDSGVLDYYGAEERLSPDTESIPFCLSTDDGELATLVERIMKLAPVQFNPKSYSTMYSKLYEVFNNAKTHGKTLWEHIHMEQLKMAVLHFRYMILELEYNRM